MPPEVVGYVRDLAALLAGLRPDLVGVYLHGSAVLGGFHATGSDVDVLVVVAEPGTPESQRSLGEALVATADACPGAGLELSVITALAASTVDDRCPFEVHVAVGPSGATVVPGAGHPGDPDLVLHAAVCREHGLAVAGPPPDRVFAALPRDRVLAAMVRELRWALDHAPEAYAVLNACRAVRFAEDGRLCSKLDAGRWYLARHPGDPVVAAALDRQRRGERSPVTDSAARFVTEACSRL